MSHALTEQLSQMLGSGAGIGCVAIAGSDGLWPVETQAIARAIPPRRAEFAAGRRAARSALQGLGHAPVAIPVGDHRAPLWPDGIVGSITHDNGYALAAVLHREALGLGIDLTEAAPLPGATRSAILPHPEETGISDLAARAGFSAKETLFKALFPLVKVFFGFSTARVDPDLSRGAVEISLTETVGQFEAGTHWSIGVAVHQTYILTALRI